MSARSQIRKVFPGGNTSVGFYSFYHHIIEPDATRIFVLKGGPGVGKSTFMRKVAESMLSEGYDVELHCCSSDNDSLDGVVIPAIGVAMLDGTAPHVVDPKNPGAVDEIINLGEYWNEDQIRRYKQEVLNINRRVGRLFNIAYYALREARVAQDELASYFTECTNFAPINNLTSQLIQTVLDQAAGHYQQLPKDRHLFASAITPGGLVHYLDTLLDGVDRLYVIDGEPGTGKSTLLGKIGQAAVSRGLDTEFFHNPLVPERIDLVIIPSLRTALISKTPPFDTAGDLTGDKVVGRYNLNAYIDHSRLYIYQKEIEAARERVSQNLNRAIDYINQAKATHDEMENYYVPAMDFAAIDGLRQTITKRILEYAKE